ncbi:MAG: DUF305 domain-containing protein [Gemmatimonadota bacterium]|nr:DUF305 domain-containing protein [Gemmatimonadota bacterium]
MTFSRIRGAAMLVVGMAIACTTVAVAAAQTSNPTANSLAGNSPSEIAAIAKARADSARYPYTAADIKFMTGMIGHHSQAILMSSWAPTHGASPAVQTLAARITNAQRDEIVTMQQWLRDRQQPVPDGHAAMTMDMPGMDMAGSEHHALMPGMLTDPQLRQLDSARGPEFDRLFLTDMIQHHTGAVTMVKELFDTYGAAQDELIFKFASDVNVDQTTEIARMKRLLVAQMFESVSP